MNNIVERVKGARRVSTPIISIRTPDPAATMQSISSGINGGSPKIRWDAASGFAAVNDEGLAVLENSLDGADPGTVSSPADALSYAKLFPPKTVLFAVNLHRYFQSGSGNESLAALVTQAIWNLRDDFKSNQRMLIILCPDCDLPAEIIQDVMVLDEELPSEASLRSIIHDLHSSAELDNPSSEIESRAIDALRGLASFAAEQAVAQSLTKDGIDLDILWERKRRLVEQTPGVSVYGGPDNFDSIGGCEAVKEFLKNLISGKRPPKAVVFIDEIEKGLAGATNGTGDSSGVSQALHGGLLGFMEDKKARGVIFVGPPGAAKSAVAKALGNEANVPTVQLDLSGLKGSLVGQSERNLRSALKVIEAVGEEDVFFVATCNREADLSPEIKRRFSYGTWFFDLPDKKEREKIWLIHMKSYGIEDKDIPIDLELTGAEIRNACDLSYSLNISLKDAVGYLVPVAVSGASQIEALRKQANGRFLSASKKGVYRPSVKKSTNRRTLEV
ncbi:MAG: ATP-binding protein [Flavobacteriaceae bacterium]